MTIAIWRRTAALPVLALAAALPAAAAQVIANDLVVNDSICVGADCVASENFGFDTLRLKGTALRIHFHDTSSPTYGYPSTDWRIEINSNDSGGPNHFRLEVVDSGLAPLTVEGGAGMHALYVGAAGVGLGTNAPATALHISGGDSPALRLHQNTSQAYLPYAWDLGGNEAGFFVRDVTGGGTLPLRIRAGAPANALHVTAAGRVGLGTDTADTALHIVRSDGTAAFTVEELSPTAGNLSQMFLSNAGGRSRLQMKGAGNPAQTGDWSLSAGSTFVIQERMSGSNVLIIDASGNVTLTGTLTQGSDRASKTAVEPVDPVQVLDALAGLEISAWSYADDTRGTRHMGPMAQDFHALFGLGADGTGLSALDTSGVALAAIQALARENADLRARTGGLLAQIGDLTARIAALEGR